MQDTACPRVPLDHANRGPLIRVIVTYCFKGSSDAELRACCAAPACSDGDLVRERAYRYDSG